MTFKLCNTDPIFASDNEPDLLSVCCRFVVGKPTRSRRYWSRYRSLSTINKGFRQRDYDNEEKTSPKKIERNNREYREFTYSSKKFSESLSELSEILCNTSPEMEV